jgi:hypothetical protein
VGIPKGHDTVIVGKEFKITPKFLSISPNEGSIGGSVLIAKVPGLGLPAN